MTPTRWQQIAQLFDEASELTPSARPAWLDVACAGDGELRREVEQMLAADEQANGFMSQPAAELAATQLAAEQTFLPASSHVAHFEILKPLGAGAMGEVYLAHDTRLERQVALKLLPARFTQEAGRLRRFSREARAASALNHHNIITVHEVGQDGEHHFIATEFVEGVTLRERLADGALPCEDALAIAAQIAAALETAHAAGIVHRDIKPENVMLRADGVVKVLDFGIAKLLQKADPAGDTARPNSTEQGTVIGTPGYMSPEQARGFEVDARTDIFSCGVVLYEMLAGHAPFRGATKADVIAALLERTPEPLAVNPKLNEVIAKALAKDATQRYQTVEALRADLQAINTAVDAWVGVRTNTKLLRKPWARLAVTAGALLMLFLAGTLAWRYFARANAGSGWSARSNFRFTTPYSKRLGLGGSLSRPVLSPDGQRVAFSLAADNERHIVVRELSDGKEVKLTNDAAITYDNPVWSPDGTRLATIAQSQGRREIRVLAYPPSTAASPAIVKEMSVASAIDYLVAWQNSGPRERIYYESWYNLHAFDPATGQTEQLTQFDTQKPLTRGFRPSPDGQQIAYLDARDNRFFLMLKPLQGPPIMLLESTESLSSPSWFPDGQRLAYIAKRDDNTQIFVVHLATRTVEQVTSGNEDFWEIHVSTDGKRILAASARENASIFAWDFNQDVEVERTSELGLQLRPEPSPDGQHLLFQALSSFTHGKINLFSQALRPGNPPLKLATEAQHARWSPDGASIAFIHPVPGAHELWIADAKGEGARRLVASMTPSRFQPTPYLANFTDYAWSPDSTRIAYNARKSGISNLWLIDRAGTHDTNLTNNADPTVTVYSPHWSPAGEPIAYGTTKNATEQTPPVYSVWLNEAGRNKLLVQRNLPLHIAGWTDAGRTLLFAVATQRQWNVPQEIELRRFEVAQGKETLLLKIPAAYLPSLRLAQDGRRLVVVTRQQGRDNLELISLNGRTNKRLTSNSDPTVFYTSPAWAADGRSLFYSKQTSWQLLNLLEAEF